MAAEVVAPPAEVPAVVDAKAAAGKKEKLKRLDKPDRTILDGQTDKLMAQVERCQGRINEIKAIIDAKRNNRTRVSSGSQMARQQLQGLRVEFKAALDEKNALRERLQASDAARDTLRSQARAVKDKLSFIRVEQIDEEISRIEHTMSHTTMTLNEEKKLLTQVKDLSKSRMFVKEYNERMERITEDEGARKDMVDAIKACDERINGIKAREVEQREVIDQIRAKEDNETADVPALTEERNQSYELIKEAKEAIRKLRGEFKAKEDEYYTREREFRNQMREEKQKRWEAAQEERKQRDIDRKKREIEFAGEPYDKEVTMCEQLISYLNKFVAKEEEKVEEKKEVATEWDGRKILRKKADTLDGLDAMFGGLGGGKKGKKGKKGPSEKPADAGPKKLSHSLDTMSSFSTVKVDVPLTSGDAPAAIDALKARKEKYLEMRVVKKAELLKQAEAAEAAVAVAGPAVSRGPRGPVSVYLKAEDDSVTVTLKVRERGEGRGDRGNREGRRGDKKEAAGASNGL